MKEDNSESNPNDLCFYGSDPGAVKHGNFINYYSFHNVHTRINNLHPLMFPPPIDNQLVCLDIGCNTGDLTKAVYEYLKDNNPDCEIRILAVDIDPKLIERAKELNHNSFITFRTLDIMAENDRLMMQDFLSTCKKHFFDAILCFSVTMWIHLNHGDEGLLEFLNYMKSICRGIVIESQSWQSYRNAQRRVKKTGKQFDHYKSLKIKGKVNDVIEDILMADSFCKIYESTSSSWKRKIKSFQSLAESVNS